MIYVLLLNKLVNTTLLWSSKPNGHKQMMHTHSKSTFANIKIKIGQSYINDKPFPAQTIQQWKMTNHFI